MGGEEERGRLDEGNDSLSIPLLLSSFFFSPGAFSRRIYTRGKWIYIYGDAAARFLGREIAFVLYTYIRIQTIVMCVSRVVAAQYNCATNFIEGGLERCFWP